MMVRELDLRTGQEKSRSVFEKSIHHHFNGGPTGVTVPEFTESIKFFKIVLLKYALVSSDR